MLTKQSGNEVFAVTYLASASIERFCITRHLQESARLLGVGIVSRQFPSVGRNSGRTYLRVQATKRSAGRELQVLRPTPPLRMRDPEHCGHVNDCRLISVFISGGVNRCRSPNCGSAGENFCTASWLAVLCWRGRVAPQKTIHLAHFLLKCGAIPEKTG